MVLPILSVIDVINYGTMLQSYALQRILLDVGYDVEIVNYPHRELLKQVRRIFDFNLVKAKWKSINKNRIIKRDAVFADYEKKKNHVFYLFRNEGFILSEKLLNRKELIQYISTKNAIVLGSDQVWNPINLGRDYFTMSFVPKKVKKIAYAPSFGVSSIPKKQIRKTKRYLKRIDFLSVRETSGARIIKELTGREAKVVCDPTLLLTDDLWQKEERKIENLPSHYIFCYFLGDSAKNRSFANNLKSQTNYKIVNLPFMDEFVDSDKNFGDIIPKNVGPREFLYLIHNATYVCTDSFHGTVFSLQFHRCFYSMPRTSVEGKASTSSRITDLLNLVGLDDCFIENPVGTDIKNLIKMSASIKWKDVDKYIKIERDKSMKYLIKSLEG